MCRRHFLLFKIIFHNKGAIGAEAGCSRWCCHVPVRMNSRSSGRGSGSGSGSVPIPASELRRPGDVSPSFACSLNTCMLLFAGVRMLIC